MKIFYCRIGWMEYYHGDDNERPINGGKYNKEKIGHEIYNFKNYNGHYFGYVQADSIHIEKLSVSKNDNKINDVLVVWVAKSTGGGEFVVGWYKNAIVYRNYQCINKIYMRNRKDGYTDYNIESDNAVLLRVDERILNVSNCIGQNNIWYGNDTTNLKVLEFINDYESKDDYNEIEKNEISKLILEKNNEVLLPMSKEKMKQETTFILDSDREVAKRNIKKAQCALKRAKYKCQYDESDRVFLRKNGIPYTEPHHLIPLSKYKDFDYALDVEQNIVSLCSHCHNLLHYGRLEDKKLILEKLWNDRYLELEEIGISISFDKLLSYY